MSQDKKPKPERKRSIFSRNSSKSSTEDKVEAPKETKPAPVRRRRRARTKPVAPPKPVVQPKPAEAPKPVAPPKPVVQPKPVEASKPVVPPKPVEKPKANDEEIAKNRLKKIKQVRHDLMNNKFFRITKAEAAPLAARMVDQGAKSIIGQKKYFSYEERKILCRDLSKKHNLKL